MASWRTGISILFKPCGLTLPGLALLLGLGPTTMATAAPPFSVPGSEWSIVSLASATVTDDVERFVQFAGEGRVSGHSGCNGFFGTYSQTADVLKIGPLASTKKLCRKNVMDIERKFLDALQISHKVVGGHLAIELMSSHGDTVLSLKRRDWD